MAEKGIKTVWINSDSVGVLGTKVYRDDVLIATVPIGIQFYNDPTAIVGVEYKYEVQAYTSTSESTDETLGVNTDYYTIQDETQLLKPVMTNFEIRDDEVGDESRIYFSTPLGNVDGINIADFDVPYNNILGYTKVNETEAYFTLQYSHSYWNIVTISKDGDNSVVYDFTKEFVLNKISEPTASTIRFANSTGSGLTDGSSEANAWSFAQMDSAASSGMTVYCKVGGQSSANLTFTNSGTASSPIKFIGYITDYTANNGQGDIITNYYSYPDALDNTKMPTMFGSTRDSGEGFDPSQRSYIIFKNFNIGNYRYGVQLWNSSYQSTNLVFERCNMVGFGGLASDLNGYGVNANSTQVNKLQFKDCNIGNSTQTGLYLSGNNHLVKDCNIFADEDGGGVDTEIDYYVLMQGSNSVCYNTNLEAIGAIGPKGGQGFAMKSDATGIVCYDNLIQNCYTKNISAPIQYRWDEVKYNVVKGTTVDGSGGIDTGGLQFRDGAKFNIFENGEIKNCINSYYGPIGLYDTSGEQGTGQTLEGNIIRNTVIVGGGVGQDSNMAAIKFGLSVSGTDIEWLCLNNKIQNCTFKNIPQLYNLNSGITLTGFEMTNCIIDEVPLKYSGNAPSVTETYNLYWDFWGSNGTPESGTGNMSVNPDLDANYQPQATFTDIDVPKISGINYGKNGNERQDLTTVGSILSADEIPNEPPIPTSGVFPGALGFGSEWEFTSNYEVRVVINLNNSGTGSLRNAITDSSTYDGVIIVFNGLSGIITLSSEIETPSGHQLYIAGQTSENGIFIAGSDYDGKLINSSNANGLIVRGIGFGRGLAPVNDARNNDCVGFGYNSQNGIYDHCTFLWATDETFQIWGGGTNVTVQNSIIAEAPYYSSSPTEPHSLGLLLGSDDLQVPTNITAANMIYVDMGHRLPNIADSKNVEVSRSVSANCGSWVTQVTYVQDVGARDINLRNIYSIRGINTNITLPQTITSNSPYPATTQIWAEGNFNDARVFDTDDQWTALAQFEDSITPVTTNQQASTKHDFPLKDLPILQPQELFKLLYDDVGTFTHTDTEVRILEKASSNTCSMINWVDGVDTMPPLPTIATGSIITDTNNNGIPDSLEGTWGNDTKGYVDSIAVSNNLPFPELTDSLISYYAFNNDVNDGVSSNNGTANNLTYSTGLSGQAIQLTGTSGSNVVLADDDSLSFGSNPFSISLNVKFDVNKSVFFVSKYADTSEKEYQFYFEDNTLKVILWDTGGSAYISATGSFTPTIGVWYNISLTWDGGGLEPSQEHNLNIYLDGADIKAGYGFESGTYTTMKNSTAPVYVGEYQRFSSNNFDGSIDNLAFWNKKLNQQEIIANMKINQSGSELI